MIYASARSPFARRARSLYALLCAAPLVLAACSDDGDGESLGAPETSTTVPSTGDGDGDTATGDGDGDTVTDSDATSITTMPTGDGDGDGDTAGDGDGDTAGDGDGDTGGDGDGDTSGDGDGDPGPVDNSTYTAIAMPGGLDRVIITRTNVEEPNCSRMVIYHPVMFDDFDIDMPQDWRIESVENWKQGFCPMDLMNPTNFPDDGTGEITFGSLDGVGIYPCSINFDIELDMNSDPPSTTFWNTTGIPVEGVNCG